MPAMMSANWLWSSVQMRIRPAWWRDASAHSRASGAKSRLLRVMRIALANGLPLSTADPGDFREVDGLEVVVIPVP